MPAKLAEFPGRGQALSHGFKRRPDSTIALEAKGGTNIRETVFSQGKGSSLRLTYCENSLDMLAMLTQFLGKGVNSPFDLL